MMQTVMVCSPETGWLSYALCRLVPRPEGSSPRVSPGSPLVPLAGVSEARLKSKLFALRFPPNLTHSGSSRPSWLCERRSNRSWCGMSPGSASAFRLPCHQTNRPSLQGFAGRLRVNLSCDVLIRSLSYTWRRLQRFGKSSGSGPPLALRITTCLPRTSKAPFHVRRFPGYVLAHPCLHNESLGSAQNSSSALLSVYPYSEK